MITLNTALLALQSLLHIIEMLMEAKTPEQRAAEMARFDKITNALIDMVERLKDRIND